jgi:hypothetical protein
MATVYFLRKQPTTYSTATTSANGLMSSSDKSKLDGLFEYLGDIVIQPSSSGNWSPITTSGMYLAKYYVDYSGTAGTGYVYYYNFFISKGQDVQMYSIIGSSGYFESTNGGYQCKNTSTGYQIKCEIYKILP